MAPKVAELDYGAWPSPITARSLVQGAVGIGDVVVDGETIWWSESRPEEKGRVAIMRRDGDATVEALPADVNVRTSVHEYGGGAWWADRGSLWFVDFADQRLRLSVGGELTVLTPEPSSPRGLRYADGRPTPDHAWYVCVRESHAAGDDHAPPTNEIVAVRSDGSEEVVVLVTGPDFVAAPRLSADGTQLAWIQWNNPDMPWDATELCVAPFTDGVLGDATVVAGGPTESVLQPLWHTDGSLYAISDRTDWWGLYRWVDPEAAGDPEPVDVGEFEVGTPAWVFNMQRYAITDRGAVTARTSGGADVLVEPGGKVTPTWSAITSLQARGDDAVFIGASHAAEAEIVRVGANGHEIVQAARDLDIDPAFFPSPEHITFDVPSGKSGVAPAQAHALYYAPANPNVVGTAGTKPPLLVKIHGGPTAAARSQLQLGTRYWTSRGIAVVDVNYRGSIGYGRKFRQALNGNWGVADVADAVAGARYLADRGDVDGERLAIAGGSAGGFTVLAALTFHDAFSVGASRYGIADLSTLATDTHKFEARYLDRLVGRWPEDEATYRERSPIHFMDQLSCPMIILQGGEDKVVPPNQAELMVEALDAQSLPYAYLLFEEEGHGFRQADNIVKALEAELSFFSQIFGVTPAGDVPSIAIQNFSDASQSGI